MAVDDSFNELYHYVIRYAIRPCCVKDLALKLSYTLFHTI